LPARPRGEQLTHSLNRTITERIDPAAAQLPELSENARRSMLALEKAGQEAGQLATEVRQLAQRLQGQGGPMDQLGAAPSPWGGGRAAVPHHLPAVTQAASDVCAARGMGAAASGITNNPQSLIFGEGRVQPGPGEPGFAAPAAAAAKAKENTMRASTLWGAALLATGLSACSNLPSSPNQPARFDLGPLPAVAAAAPASVHPVLALADIQARAQNENSTSVLYRLAYADANAQHAYAYARWSQPPAVLVQQRLRRHPEPGPDRAVRRARGPGAARAGPDAAGAAAGAGRV
jgi:hypothetical protein